MLNFGLWSSSKGMGIIPNLEGLTLNEARTAITSAGFALGNETSIGNSGGANSSNNGKAKGRVDTGSLLQYESTIDFEYYSYVVVPTPTPTPVGPTPTPVGPTPTPYPNIGGVIAYGAGPGQAWTENQAYITWGGSGWGSYTVIASNGSSSNSASSAGGPPVLLSGFSAGTTYSVTVTLYANANYTGDSASNSTTFTTAVATPTPPASYAYYATGCCVNGSTYTLVYGSSTVSCSSAYDNVDLACTGTISAQDCSYNNTGAYPSVACSAPVCPKPGMTSSYDSVCGDTCCDSDGRPWVPTPTPKTETSRTIGTCTPFPQCPGGGERIDTVYYSDGTSTELTVCCSYTPDPTPTTPTITYSDWVAYEDTEEYRCSGTTRQVRALIDSRRSKFINGVFSEYEYQYDVPTDWSDHEVNSVACGYVAPTPTGPGPTPTQRTILRTETGTCISDPYCPEGGERMDTVYYSDGTTDQQYRCCSYTAPTPTPTPTPDPTPTPTPTPSCSGTNFCVGYPDAQCNGGYCLITDNCGAVIGCND